MIQPDNMLRFQLATFQVRAKSALEPAQNLTAARRRVTALINAVGT
jgi:hypothetical protein